MKKISKQDIALFRQAMRDVKPLAPKPGGQANIKPTTPRLKRKKVLEIEPIADTWVDAIDYNISATQPLFFTRTGLQRRALKKLQQGQFPIEARLDLHGNTVDAARKALATFLYRCYKQHMRSVCVVHGKGKHATPILKNHVNAWLQQSAYVLAFCSAQPQDGGTGAVYILLKRAE